MKIEKLDIDDLMKPINKANPCGKSISLDESFLQIKRERKSLDNEKLGTWKPSEKREINWSKIEKLCIEILTLKSKDLMICDLLLEARFYLYGLFGLVDSIQLILSLSKKFWNNIFPELDDEDSRKNSFLWLTEKIPFFMKTIPLLEIASSKKYLYYSDIEKFIFKGELNDTLSSLFNSENSEEIIIYIEKCHQNIFDLNEFLAERLFPNEKILYKSLELINILSKIFGSIHNSRQVKEIDLSAKQIEVEKITTISNTQNYDMNRSIIYQEVKKLSEMLLAQEPHSPVPILILELLKWESKSFVEMFDIIKRSSEREGIIALFRDEINDSENKYGD